MIQRSTTLYLNNRKDMDASRICDQAAGTSKRRSKSETVPNPRSICAVVGKNTKHQKFRLWLQDTGAGQDMVCRKRLSPEQLEMIKTTEDVQVFETANGEVRIDQVVPMQFGVTNMNSEALVGDDNPDLHSIGWRCQMLGWEFHWKGFSDSPYYITREGIKISLIAIDKNPYLLDYANTEHLTEDSGVLYTRHSDSSHGHRSRSVGATPSQKPDF